MKHVRGILALTLALMLCLSAATTIGMAEEQNYFKKYEPTITLTTHAVIGTDRVFQDADTADNNGYTRWCEENLGIKWELKWTTSDSATDAQKLDLAFASDDLPDVIAPTVAQLSKYVASGKIVALDDLIDQYASPLTKWVLDDAVSSTAGAYYMPFTFNGNVYAIPTMSDTLAFWTVNFIRTDIMEELGAEMPATLADLEAVFDAYKTAYPDKYPLSMDNDLTNSANGFSTVLSAFNAYMNMWQADENDQLVYTSIQPEMRAALAKMAEWYAKGYMDPEFVVMDGAKRSEVASAGDFLVYHGYWWSIGSPFGNMWINDENSDVTVMPYLKGEAEDSGKVMKSAWFTANHAITTSCENPEALFYLLNETWDSYYRDETILRDAMDQVGYTFKYPVTEVREALNVEEVSENYPSVAEPKYLWKYDYPEEVTGPGFFNDYYTHYGQLFGFTGRSVTLGNNLYATLCQAVKTGDTSILSTESLETYTGWYGSNPKMLTTFVPIYEYWDGKEFEVNAFAGANTATMTEKQSYLDKIELEAFTNIIMGSKPIEAFDEFVEQWQANGGEQITAEVNEWYAGTK